MSKRVLWVVEFFIDGKWKPSIDAEQTRELARFMARQKRANNRKTRVRKYIPA